MSRSKLFSKRIRKKSPLPPFNLRIIFLHCPHFRQRQEQKKISGAKEDKEFFFKKKGFVCRKTKLKINIIKTEKTCQLSMFFLPFFSGSYLRSLPFRASFFHPLTPPYFTCKVDITIFLQAIQTCLSTLLYTFTANQGFNYILESFVR